MKRHFISSMLLCIPLLCIFACSNNDGGGKSAPSVRIEAISFNIRVDNGVDGDNVWANRKEAVVNMIEAEMPLVMGLQEVQPHQITYLDRNCHDYAWYAIGRDTGEPPVETDSYASEESVAIFYRKNEVKLLDHGTFWLAEGAPATPTKDWGAAYMRNCSWGLFELKESGDRFYFYNTHLDNSSAQSREKSLKLIVEKIKAHETDLPVILAGDFNCETTDSYFAPLFGVMQCSRTNASSTDNKATFNNYKENGTRKLDHIFFTNCYVFRFETLTRSYGAPYISDHYPIKASFVFINGINV